MFRYLFILVSLILLIASCIPKTAKKPVDKPGDINNKVYTAYVIRDNINMRQEASIKSAQVTKVNNGDEVRVLKNKDGWYEVVNSEDQQGWIRSDFVGTHSLSYSRLVTDFVENTVANYKTEIFIDEKNPYAVIYMVLPQKYYDDKKQARKIAEEIGLKYQAAVYAGSVEIRVMHTDKKNLFTRHTLKSIGPVGLKAPFLRHGRLFAFDRINGDEIIIKVLVPSTLTNDNFLNMSEEISIKYADNISKIEIYFVENSVDGINFFTKEGFVPESKSTCRFYYLEDSQGPDYKTNFCN